MKFEYDIIVVGGGHAGCEAALAAARLGSATLLITMDMGKMAQMSCNPAIGGVAKGQIVREIDALGGEMGIITDKSTIQFRMLNRSKGAAMWSPRAQCDKFLFSQLWRETLEATDNLYMWQDSVTSLILEDSTVRGVRTQIGAEFKAATVVLTNGTFLNGLMHVGETQAVGGRAGDMASYGLSEQLKEAGFEVARMKTGTPVRLDARTIDFSVLVRQDGDEEPAKFSFSSQTSRVTDQKPCYLAYTSKEVHDILREGFDRSPMFTGVIQGIGPRYCPSIEDKLRTFANKNEHQLFLEPEGWNTNEYYINGFSSSLPLEIQVKALSKIKGLENAHIYRPGYAIEYDYFAPTQLLHSLETKSITNLYFAGQINGTTGYEEAAAQGLVAGVNAHRKIKGDEPLVLRRDQAYIGVLIDDLVMKGVDEPYRMFTSRAEYRILLRQDNADARLTPLGFELGLVRQERHDELVRKMAKIAKIKAFFKNTSLSHEETEIMFADLEQPNITQKRRINDVLIRNGVTIALLKTHFPVIRNFLSSEDATQEICDVIETDLKYEGYIEHERNQAEKLKRLENIKINPDFDYRALLSLSFESRDKLSKIRPATIAQASRIPGVSPADINVLLVYFGR